MSMPFSVSFLPVSLPNNLWLLTHPYHWEGVQKEVQGLVHPADYWQSEGAIPLMAELALFQQFVSQSPIGEAKVAFFSGVDHYRPEIVNALLKVIEEPPVYLYCLLLSESEDILPTLRSRLQRHAWQNKGIVGSQTEREQWAATIQPLTDGNPEERATAQKLLFWYPLLHQGIKTETVLAAFKETT